MSTNSGRLYELLGVDRTATKDQIKKAYRKKAMDCHPDKGGDKESFAMIRLAHDVLMDDERRDRYDRTGGVDDLKRVDLHKIVADMARRAFTEYQGDPVEQMKLYVRRSLDGNKAEREKANARIKSMTQRLEKFSKANASTKSEDARSLVESTLRSMIDEMRAFVFDADKSIESLESVAKFIEGLEAIDKNEPFKPNYMVATAWGARSIF